MTITESAMKNYRAAAANSNVGTPARKGDIALRESMHSYTEMHGKTVRYTRYEFIKVELATREGVIKAFSYEYGTKLLTCHSDRFFVISDKEKGLKVWAALAGRTFNDLESAKEAAKLAVES